MKRMSIAGMLFLLSGCSDASPSREAGSQAPPAAPVQSEAAPVSQVPPPERLSPVPVTQVPPPERLAPVPVYLGGDEMHDACGGASKVVAGSTGRTHAAVRSGPGSKYPITDSLPLDFMVSDCDGVEQGGWRGVVYDQDDEVDCGTGSPIAERQAYQGPCKSGWMSDVDLELVAG
jgi:hypothetical protein